MEGFNSNQLQNLSHILFDANVKEAVSRTYNFVMQKSVQNHESS